MGATVRAVASRPAFRLFGARRDRARGLLPAGMPPVGVADGAKHGGADHVSARGDVSRQETARHLAGVACLHGMAASAIVAIMCGMAHARMRRDSVTLVRDTHACDGARMRDGRNRHDERENEQGKGAKQPHGASL